MFYKKKKIALALSIVLVTLTAGCGSQVSATKPKGPATNLGGESSGGGGSGTVGDGSTGGSTGGTGLLPPAIKKAYSLTGADTKYEVPVNTNDGLRIKIKSEPGGGMANIPGYTNYSTTYGCASYDVTLLTNTGTEWVETETVRTQRLSVSGVTSASCPDGVKDEVIDFSGSIGPGHQGLKIRISAPRYDLYCSYYTTCANLYYSNNYAFWQNGCNWTLNQAAYEQVCPDKTVFKNHIVKGSMQIEVDGTELR